jgi:predicted nucleotide-binding protein
LKKNQHFPEIRFSHETIENAYKEYRRNLDPQKSEAERHTFEISYDGVTWDFDHLSEFLVEYVKSQENYSLLHVGITSSGVTAMFSLNGDRYGAKVSIQLHNKEAIESVFYQFVKDQDKSLIKPKPKHEVVFIGHGHDQQWKELRDHLRDHQKIEVATYEIEPRTGLVVQGVLESMLDKSTFACLMFTGEVHHNDGSVHARENVIHELGLFQGRLGFSKAIVLLEQDVEEFSNISGINQIRFSKGKIRETFGDIVATIKRL